MTASLSSSEPLVCLEAFGFRVQKPSLGRLGFGLVMRSCYVEWTGFQAEKNQNMHSSRVACSIGG